MKNKRAAERNNQPITLCIAIGVFVAILVSVLLAMLMTVLIINERVSETSIQYFDFAILLVASFCGGMVATQQTGEKRVLVSGLTAVTYCLFLVASGILFFDGGFQNLWTSAVAIAVGGIGSCVLCVRGKMKIARRKKLIR